MRTGLVYKNNETGVRVTVTKTETKKYFRWIYFIDRRGFKDQATEEVFLREYELHS